MRHPLPLPREGRPQMLPKYVHGPESRLQVHAVRGVLHSHT